MVEFVFDVVRGESKQKTKKWPVLNERRDIISSTRTSPMVSVMVGEGVFVGPRCVQPSMYTSFPTTCPAAVTVRLVYQQCTSRQWMISCDDLEVIITSALHGGTEDD